MAFLRSLLVGLVSIISPPSLRFCPAWLGPMPYPCFTYTAPYRNMLAPPFVSSDVIFFFFREETMRGTLFLVFPFRLYVFP
jgi:hypothetical protein